MSVMRAAEATAYDTHGNRFLSYVSPARGSSELCAWTLAVPAGQRGVAHRPTREEVLLVLDGTMDITLDGVPSSLAAGDVVPGRCRDRAQGWRVARR